MCVCHEIVRRVNVSLLVTVMCWVAYTAPQVRRFRTISCTPTAACNRAAIISSRWTRAWPGNVRILRCTVAAVEPLNGNLTADNKAMRPTPRSPIYPVQLCNRMPLRHSDSRAISSRVQNFNFLLFVHFRSPVYIPRLFGWYASYLCLVSYFELHTGSSTGTKPYPRHRMPTDRTHSASLGRLRHQVHQAGHHDLPPLRQVSLL